jgi:hypothetical protein
MFAAVLMKPNVLDILERQYEIKKRSRYEKLT